MPDRADSFCRDGNYKKNLSENVRNQKHYNRTKEFL